MTHVAILTLLIGFSHAHQRPTGRPFAYDPTQPQQGVKSRGVPPSPVENPEKNFNPIVTHVSISGNFGGVFNISGVGDITTQTQTNVISVSTNRALTFWTNSFKPLMAGNTSEPNMGNVTYTMALYQGTSSQIGSLVSGPVSGVDSGFNGKTLVLNKSQIPSGGNLVLVLTRTLNLTASSTGASNLVGAGNIGVTIN